MMHYSSMLRPLLLLSRRRLVHPLRPSNNSTCSSNIYNRAMATSLTFERITPAPDATLKTTPLTRSSHGLSALSDGKRLVLFGGENVARTPIAEARQSVWVADNKTGEDWKWISPLPSDGPAPSLRVAHAQAAVGDEVYVFGGRNGIEMGENALNDMWKLQIVTSDDGNVCAEWTEITPVGDEVPEARSFHKMIAVGTGLYIFGGCCTNGRLNDLWKFDTITRKWTSLGNSSVLKGRGGPNILSLKNENGAKIAVVAGFAGEETNDGHIFTNDSWEAKGMETLSDMRKRSVCSFGSLPKHNVCIVFGGEVDPSAKGHEGAGNFDRDLMILDGTSGSLLEVVKPSGSAPWPKARGWADATVANGDTFYMFGGLAGDDASPVRLDDLWTCQISST